jgi:hypothetical protein
MIDGVVTSGPGAERCARIEMDQAMAKAMRKYKPGSVIKVVLVGKVEELNLSKPEDPAVKGYEGMLELCIQKHEVLDSARNAIAELLDDDE